MAQHDYSIANQGFPATRADINNVLSAIATNNSGTSAPSTQYAGQFWLDTTSSNWVLYIHDGADDIQFATIDTSANTVNFIDSELADGSVTNAKLGADAVDGTKIADDSIDSEHYVDGSIDTAHIADSQITTAKINDGAITSAKIASGVIPGAFNPFRNIIINGDMSIAQRGTSQATAGSGGGSYQTLDRYKLFNGNLGAFTWSQDTDVPSGQGFANSMKFDCTTADASPAANDYLLFSQIFEGQNLQYLKKGTANAESLTLSFWVKSVKTGTFIIELADNNNTRQISKSYTINSASTWEKKTITFAGDTTGTLDNDNGSSLSAQFWLAAGTDFTSGTLSTTWTSTTVANRAVGQVNLADNTANEWYITGVQLEAGTSASDFEFLPHDVNLLRCQRYCYSESAGDTFHNYVNGFLTSSTLFIGNLNLPTSMRAGPSITTSGSFAVSGTAAYSASSFSIVDSDVNDVNTIEIRAVTSGATAGQGARIRNDNDATATFILSSEL